MPTNRRPRRHAGKVHLTPEAIAAWQAADHSALHCALGLTPWDDNPLRVEQDPPRDPANVASWQCAIKLQRALLAAAGQPDWRAAYEKNLRDAEEMLAYYTELVRHPDRGGHGTASDPIARRHKLEEAESEVAYRRELLAGLD